MLRALVVALLAANLLFFAWTRGALAPLLPPPSHGEREPERLAQQVRPETIRFFATPAAASAALAATAPPRCLEAGPLAEADLPEAEAALAALPPGTWTRRDAQPPPVLLVALGRFATPAALRAKEDELRRLKVAFEPLDAPPEVAPGLLLSRHASRDAAEAALAQAAQAGVRSARIVDATPPVRHWLRVERADAALRERLAAIRPGGAGFVACR